jgi:hypothetical protein
MTAMKAKFNLIFNFFVKVILVCYYHYQVPKIIKFSEDYELPLYYNPVLYSGGEI